VMVYCQFAVLLAGYRVNISCDGVYISGVLSVCSTSGRLQGQRLRDQTLISGRDVGFSHHHIHTGS